MPQLFVDVPQAFTPQECNSIIALAEGLQAGTVYGEAGAAVRPEVRNVETCFRPRSAETAWLYDRLDGWFAEAALALGVEVGPMREDIQLMRYGPGGHFQLWHSDAGYDAKQARILSVSVELSEKSDYDGGDLEIVPDAMGRARTLPRGGARFFLSRALHRVTPVIRGTRWSLVNWTGAPPSSSRA
jgi:PKHD-type hydroxylase